MTVSTTTRASDFVRYIIVRALKKDDVGEQLGYASARWGSTSLPARMLMTGGPETKAAIGGATPYDWGSELASEYAQAASEFLAMVRARTVAGQLSRLRRTPPNIPMIVQSARAKAGWVAPGAGIPLSAPGFTRGIITPRKLAAMVVVSNELLAAATPLAESVIQEDLLTAIAEASDLAFIDPGNSGVAEQTPPSVTDGVTPLTATGDFKADLERMVAAFQGDLSAAYLVGRPELFVQLSGADFPNIGARGGEIAGIPALPTTGLPNDGDDSYQLALIDPTGITYATNDGATEIKSSRQASIQMSDTPTQNSGTPTGTTTVSLFQVEATAIAALLHENWEVARPGSVALMDGIAPSVEAP